MDHEARVRWVLPFSLENGQGARFLIGDIGGRSCSILAQLENCSVMILPGLTLSRLHSSFHVGIRPTPTPS